MKYWSAGAGFIITLAVVCLMGPVPNMSSELKMSAEAFLRTIAILSCFILSSSLISVAGRISIRLWALVRHLILKLKKLGKAGTYEMPV